ncbi:MAG TPA: hypothetical protein VGA23_00225, partial [Methylomirabilota bacterium]
TVAKDLNRESDGINDLLSHFEEQIAKLNVGIESAIKISGEDTYLQWRKLTRQVQKPDSTYYEREEYWGLAIDGDPALKASRDLRIAALEKLPDLVRDLTWEAKSRLDVIKKAKTLVK